MIRVGFVLDIDESWLGGINYHRNLLSAIQSMPDKKIEPVVFTGKHSKGDILKGLPSIELIQISLLDRFSPQWIVRLIYRSIFSHDYLLERALEKHNISVLSHYYSYLGKHAKIPTIGWIPDFQHRHLPEFFSGKERIIRDRLFKNICRMCSYVLLSSYNAQKDLSDFALSCVSKSRVLHFVKYFKEELDITNLNVLENRYKFQGQYFLMPNQFWKHKNHLVIIEALNILKSTNRKVLVLATGNTQDYRQTNYFNELMNFARKSDVLDCFRVLGIVPYKDVIALMRNSLSVINPSLFEGWSSIVEEAKSLGKRIILSDIPVHREQSPEGGIYFDPTDAHTLADTMWRLWFYRDLDLEKKLIHDARRDLPSRVHKFVKTYEEIVIEVISKNRHS